MKERAQNSCRPFDEDAHLKHCQWGSLIPICCEDIPGFEAVATGDKVDYALVSVGLVKKVKEAVALKIDVSKDVYKMYSF